MDILRMFHLVSSHFDQVRISLGCHRSVKPRLVDPSELREVNDLLRTFYSTSLVSDLLDRFQESWSRDVRRNQPCRRNRHPSTSAVDLIRGIQEPEVNCIWIVPSSLCRTPLSTQDLCFPPGIVQSTDLTTPCESIGSLPNDASDR